MDYPFQMNIIVPMEKQGRYSDQTTLPSIPGGILKTDFLNSTPFGNVISETGVTLYEGRIKRVISGMEVNEEDNRRPIFVIGKDKQVRLKVTFTSRPR